MSVLKPPGAAQATPEETVRTRVKAFDKHGLRE